ncbi:unnamed protein product [Coregonus sp. 'balchen']|nr:unnamed protein product [Coregonus sp. 'balchen']
MAPYVAAMTSDQLLGPQICSPIGEVKVLPEEGRGEKSAPCPQEVMDCYGHAPSMTHSPSTDREAVSGSCSPPVSVQGRWPWSTGAAWNTGSLPPTAAAWLGSPAMQHQRRTLCGDVICFLFITPLASLSGWLCVQGAMDLTWKQTDQRVRLQIPRPARTMHTHHTLNLSFLSKDTRKETVV